MSTLSFNNTPTPAERDQRTANIRRAFGCRHDDAREIADGKTRFARAALHFGGLLCWYVKDRYQWTLAGAPLTKTQIADAANIPNHRFGPRRKKDGGS